jgi:hypothetical protein
MDGLGNSRLKNGRMTPMLAVCIKKEAGDDITVDQNAGARNSEARQTLKHGERGHHDACANRYPRSPLFFRNTGLVGDAPVHMGQ